MIHELALERRSVHGRWSRDLEPVVTIDAGDSIRFESLAIFWTKEWPDPLFERDPDDGHALSGPIEVRGARAGQTLVVRIDEVVPGPWGVTLTHPPHVLEWKLDGEQWVASTGHRVPARPFLGVLGMPPVGHGRHSTIPPRRQGGNIDCKELVAGTTLYLPIPVDGALFSAGDGHGAQGDGEVSGTAIETPARAQLTLDVRDDLPLEWPCARIDGAWLTFGFDEDLGVAAKKAVDGMVALMGREHGLAADDALALASVCVDLRVTQVVNGQLGVHAVLRDDSWNV